ncbi:MAG: hypothetical protein HYT82_02400 [Candidatus Harrisonbacteria bacterium]|nr:hypothetical protein [Candidatus Harrisonbacteria bacterium]MBI2604200.1 hypothetical protein [Candidatus Harrisonbacteria bacterium]
MNRYNKTAIIAAVVLGVAAFSPARAGFFGIKTPSLSDALRDVKASIETLARAKDAVTTENREKEEFRAKTQALKKIIELGKLEVADLRARLANFRIEELVADDFTFDAVETANNLAGMLEGFAAYDDAAGVELLNAQNTADIKKIASDMRAWREETYNPGVKKILSLGLLLQNRAALKTASVRFDKILADLRKLKSAELISFETLQPSTTAAGASIRKAKALNDDATGIMFHILRATPASENEERGAPLSAHERIANLLDQSFAELRAAYKAFLEMNGEVKKMLGVE